MTLLIILLGDDRPTLKDLYNYVVHGVAKNWRDLGVQLLDPSTESMLGIIEKNHPQDVIGCCKSMFQYWLDTRLDASWSQLLVALRSPCVQLNCLAEQIEHKLTKKRKEYFYTHYCILNIVYTVSQS